MAFEPSSRMLQTRGAVRRLLAEDKRFTRVLLAGLAPDDEPILLRDIYVPLRFSLSKLAENVTDEAIDRTSLPLDDWILQSASGRWFYLAGEPGSGKSTFVKALVASFASTSRDDLNQLFPDALPVAIFLREVPKDRLSSLESLVSWWCDDLRQHASLSEVAALVDFKSVEAFFEAGRVVLVLDGLDELGSLERRRTLLDALANSPWLARSQERRGLTLVTARPPGFQELQLEQRLGQMLYVAPFRQVEIKEYLVRWFELRPQTTHRRENTVSELTDRLFSEQEKDRLLPMARRPAYLTALAFVHGTRGELPHTRAKLFDMLVDAYLETLDRQQGLRFEETWDRQEKLEVLSFVARRAQEGGGARRQPWERERTFFWSRAELERVVGEGLEAGAERYRTLTPSHAGRLTDYFLARTGLLAEVQENRFQFPHLSLQEYLTALDLLDQASAEENKVAALERDLFGKLGEPGWDEVGLLLLSIDAARTRGRGHEAILAGLDPTNAAHIDFLAAALAEREVRFTPTERESWAVAWALAWVGLERVNLASRDRVLQMVSGEAVLGRTRCQLLEGWLVGVDPLGLAKETFFSANEGQSRLGAFVAKLCSPKDRDRLLAHSVLLLPPEEELQPQEALLLVAAAKRLEFPPAKQGKLPELPTAWSPLVGRGFHLRALGRVVAEETPLGWWRVESFLLALAPRSEENPSVLAAWRIGFTTRILEVEGLLWSLPTDPALALALALARDLVRPRARDLALHLAQDLDRALARARALALARALARDLALALALALARDRNLGLDWALARARPRARFLAELFGAKASPHSEKFEALLRQRSADRATVEAAVSAHAALLGSLAGLGLDWGKPVKFCRRELQATLAAWQSGAVLGDLSGELAEQAAREWRELLDSSASPIPWLEAALAEEWDSVELSAEAAVQRFNRTIDEIWKRLPKEKRGSLR